jgi:calcineurin-like phosphoesterase family protein
MKYFTADTHFGDLALCAGMMRLDTSKYAMQAVITDVEHHDRMIADNINKVCGRDDTLYILGDFCLSDPQKYRKMINCRDIQFIMGNHDEVGEIGSVFGTVRHSMTAHVKNPLGDQSLKLHLCHYPCAYWNGSHRGWGHLYGHVHGQREAYLDDLEPQRRALDVGVDNAYAVLGEYRPFSEYEVWDYMSRRSGHDDVRFYHDFREERRYRDGLG